MAPPEEMPADKVPAENDAPEADESATEAGDSHTEAGDSHTEAGDSETEAGDSDTVVPYQYNQGDMDDETYAEYLRDLEYEASEFFTEDEEKEEEEEEEAGESETIASSQETPENLDKD
jgi:hypothetical protein